jgi:hypothetical protein
VNTFSTRLDERQPKTRSGFLPHVGKERHRRCRRRRRFRILLSLTEIEVSVPIAISVAVGSASLTGENATGYVLPMLPQSDGAATAKGMLLRPILAAAAAYGTVTMLVGTVDKPLMLMALGAGSEVSGAYAAGTVLPIIGFGPKTAAQA